MSKELGFMDLVEIHERRWATQQYPGRPSLKELMKSPIVAVWACKANFTFACYRTAEEINEAITGLVTGKILNPDNRKLARIFYHQQPLTFTLQVVRAKLPLQAAKADETKPGNGADPDYILPSVSDVSRGATYRPKTVNRHNPYAPDIIDVNPQRTPRFYIEEKQPVQLGSCVQYLQPLKARNQILPGRKVRHLPPK